MNNNPPKKKSTKSFTLNNKEDYTAVAMPAKKVTGGMMGGIYKLTEVSMVRK